MFHPDERGLHGNLCTGVGDAQQSHTKTHEGASLRTAHNTQVQTCID